MNSPTTSNQTIASGEAIRFVPDRAAPSRIGNRVANAWSRFMARIRDGLSRQALNRRVIASLSTLSERDLADIGLTLSDVRDAGLSENGDATHFLVARRDARRAAWLGHRPF